MNPLQWLLDKVTPDIEPNWKKNPEFYHFCSSCDEGAVNANWMVRDEIIEWHPRWPKKEIQFKCPNCGHWDDIETHEELRFDNFDLEEL